MQKAKIIKLSIAITLLILIVTTVFIMSPLVGANAIWGAPRSVGGGETIGTGGRPEPAGFGYRDAIHFINGWSSISRESSVREISEDIILLESQGRLGLIDAGHPGRGNSIVDYVQRLTGERRIHFDWIIGTHAHGDHKGGFEQLIQHPDVTIGHAYFRDYRITAGASAEWQTYGPFDRDYPITWGGFYFHLMYVLTNEFNIPRTMLRHDTPAHRDYRITLGNMNVTIMGAQINSTAINDQSLTQFVEINGFTALMMADLASSDSGRAVAMQNERDIRATVVNRQIDVLKVGHHGQAGHRAESLNVWRPRVAVVPNGFNRGTFPSGGGQINGQSDGTARITAANPQSVQMAIRDNGGLLVVICEHGNGYWSPINEFMVRRYSSAWLTGYQLLGQNITDLVAFAGAQNLPLLRRL